MSFQSSYIHGLARTEPHPYFTRKGDDIYLDLPICPKETVLGGKVKVPTPSGAVTAAVPKCSNPGRVLRLKGRGVPRADASKGDKYVTLKLVLLQRPDRELERLFAQWEPAEAQPVLSARQSAPQQLTDAEICPGPGFFIGLGPSTIGIGTSSINNSFGFAAVP